MHQLLPREIIISTNPSVFNACACTSSLKFIRLYSIGDCDAFNAKYPGCKAWPSSVENGYCDPDANTEECKYDGGEFGKHPNLLISFFHTNQRFLTYFPTIQVIVMLSTKSTQVARHGQITWEMENVMPMRTTKSASLTEVSLLEVNLIPFI